MGYISRAAFSEGEALSRWLLPSWTDFPSCFGTTSELPSLFATSGLIQQQYSVTVLHVFHHVFGALHQNYSLEGRMLAHDPTYPVHSYDKLREEGLDKKLYVRGGCEVTRKVVPPASICRTSGSRRSSHGRHRVASAGPWWCLWAPDHRAHPDTPRINSSRSGPENPCWLDLDKGEIYV